MYQNKTIIISYHIKSYRIISYHIRSYHIISYYIISYQIKSDQIISYQIRSYHIISNQIMLYHIRSYHRSIGPFESFSRLPQAPQIRFLGKMRENTWKSKASSIYAFLSFKASSTETSSVFPPPGEDICGRNGEAKSPPSRLKANYSTWQVLIE